MPDPKVIWAAEAVLVTSKVCGSSHTSGSKLAATRLVATSVPAGNTTPRYSMSSEAMRAVY